MKTQTKVDLEEGITVKDAGFFIGIFICLLVMYCLAGQLDNALIWGSI